MRRTVHSSVRNRRGGFTLVEVLVAAILLTIGITAILTAIGSANKSSTASSRLNQAVFLAQEIHERIAQMSFVDPNMNTTYKPPKDAMGNSISSLGTWSQAITITWRDPNSLTTTVTAGTSDIAYVQVVVAESNTTQLTTGWYVRKKN